MQVAAPSPALDQQGTAEGMGLPSYSHMTLCGSKQIWKSVIELAGEVCKAQCKLRDGPLTDFFWGLLFPSHQTSLLSLLILCIRCLCELVNGLQLHLLMEIVLTFIFICWHGYTFQPKLACLV